jgi:hypothetical protein
MLVCVGDEMEGLESKFVGNNCICVSSDRVMYSFIRQAMVPMPVSIHMPLYRH